MSVKTYSLKKDGEKKLSKNFRVREFKCKDGSDEILIDSKLVNLLQHIRDELGVSLKINSGYRTPTYNKQIGGSSNSQHTKGTAADVYTDGVDPLIIAWIADKYLDDMGGVELGSYGVTNNGYVHVDVRNGHWRAVKAYSTRAYSTYSTLFSTIRFGTSGQIVLVLTRKLYRLGLLATPATVCNSTVIKGIRAFQSKYGLTVDGIFGKKSWEKLIEVLSNEYKKSAN